MCSLPCCATCAYYYPDPGAPLGGTCSNALQRAADLAPEDACEHYSSVHQAALCVHCRDHDGCGRPSPERRLP